MKKLDMRGNPCPIPVITAKKELTLPTCEGVVVVVDNFVAIQNLEKMAKGYGFPFSHQSHEDGTYSASIVKSGEIPVLEEVAVPSPVAVGGATVLIGSNQMGRGSEELGKILIKGFIFSLTQLPTPPKAVLFLNSGIDLVCEGSNVISDLETLVSQGCEVIACGTCLNFYQKTDLLAVGEIGDMYNIASHLAVGAPLISL